MTTPLMVGRGIKIFRWERELLILTDEIPDRFKNWQRDAGGMRDEADHHMLQTLPEEPWGGIGRNILTGAGWGDAWLEET